jgi:hypothetical protein
MSTTKPWYLSRTVWASVVTILAASLGLAGEQSGTIDQPALVDAILQVVGAIAGIVALFGRLAARDRIG